MEAKHYICNKFIDVAVGIVSKWYKQYFLHPVHVIAMYLSPKYCNLAISKTFTHDYLKPEIEKLAMNRKFKKDECIPLAQDIHKYNLSSFTKDHKTITPMPFGRQHNSSPTHKKAGIICVSTERICSLQGDFVLIIIIFKTQNQQQDDDRQPKSHWIDSQVTGSQHLHSVQDR